MNQALLNSLTEAEKVLLMETDRERMEALDEDALAELHDRIRRARTKYVKIYRRDAGDRVAEKGGRGAARPANRRNAGKAEVFEDALARVSRRLAAAARQSATQLRLDRLAAARADKQSPVAAPSGGEVTPARAGQRNTADRRLTTPAAKKRVSTQAAAGKRRQAKKDSR